MKQHIRFDKVATKWLENYLATGKRIYCRQGCAGCCHLAVHATFPEAVGAAAQMSRQPTQELTGYVVRVKGAQTGWVNMKSYLKNHRQELGPCPFLDTHGACSIYSHRPLSCRALLSTRPAAWCTVDFSKLSSWDKQAYESSLDRQVVAWPTHYIADTKDFALELEGTLLESMQREKGWSLSGNFAIMVWLEQNFQLSKRETTTAELCDILASSGLESPHLLKITESNRSAHQELKNTR